jgi:hypothetical protein
MHYRLRDGLSCCQVDGSLVFLDLDADRYFRLSRPLEATVISCLRGERRPEADVRSLVQRNILIPSPEQIPQERTPAIALPVRSALEHAPAPAPVHALMMLDVAATVCSTRLWLKIRPLSHIVAALAAYRHRKTARIPLSQAPSREAHLLAFSSMFRQARRYVPIETSCLLDSVAMVRFLARRQVSAELVFGVTHNPFAAHCWVQAEGWVLNDTIGNVMAHTPIRKV